MILIDLPVLAFPNINDYLRGVLAAQTILTTTLSHNARYVRKL